MRSQEIMSLGKRGLKTRHRQIDTGIGGIVVALKHAVLWFKGSVFNRSQDLELQLTLSCNDKLS